MFRTQAVNRHRLTNLALELAEDANTEELIARGFTAERLNPILTRGRTDGGVSWSTPTAIKARGDQFMPWGAHDARGRLRIGYFDRSYDSANHKYGYTLATETSPGTLKFSFAQVTTALSDPTQGDRWFSGITVDSSFPHPSRFLGDYSGITINPSGGVGLLFLSRDWSKDQLRRPQELPLMPA